MDGDITFGVWLKRRRRQLDLTQKGLAHLAGCSVGTIRKMEADERRPSRQLAGLLAEHLEIPPDQQEPFIAFARSEPYLSDVSFPYLTPAEEPIPSVPQEVSAQPIKNNLPLGLTPFVGREVELATLDDLLCNPEVRLITILGPGGIGKTRLGIACAERRLAYKGGSETPPYKDGVIFVDLAPLAEAERLVFSLAEALNLRIQGGAREKRSSKQQLLEYLRDKHLLLVLDNFEQLLSPPQHLGKQEGADGVALVAEILGTAPEVRILVTSRERLNLRVEQVFAIDGLGFPDWETVHRETDVDVLTRYTAVQLFLQAAQRNQQDFSLETPDERLALAHICQMVDGMPLGIELAASLVDILSLVDIADELKRGFDLLETELRDVPKWQRSVRLSIDTSWRKLDQREQSVFVQLSIFRGGFTRPAAQAVTDTTLRQLSRLVNKSFIQFNKRRDRYQVHEVLRQYGAEWLSRDPELERVLDDRHSSYYCQFLADLTDDQKSTGQVQAVSAIEADIENVRLAWNHAIVRQDLDSIGSSVECLQRFYWNNGWVAQGVRELEKAEAALRIDEPIGKRGLVLGRLLAWLGQICDDGKAEEIQKESLDLLQNLGAREETLLPRICLAEAQESPEESYRQLAECLPLARESGDPWYIAFLLQRMGSTAQTAGLYEQAERQFLQALNQFRQNDDAGGVAWTIAHLSFVAGDRGRYQEALSLAQECLSVARTINFPMMGPMALGSAMYALGDYEEAEEQFQQVLALVKESDMMSWIPRRLFHLGKVAFHMGDFAHAEGQFQESLSGALEFDNLELVAQNYDILSRLDLTSGDCNKAREHLQAALQTAIPLQQPPILLALFATATELFTEKGSQEYAALFATFITNHPASQARVKERAEQLLTQLEAQLSADDLVDIRQHSLQSDLDTLAAHLLNDLEPTKRGEMIRDGVQRSPH